MTNQELFIKLINENPTLPIIPLVEGDIANDSWTRYIGSIGNSYLDKVWLSDPERMWEWDELDELVEVKVDEYCFEHECEPNDQLFELMREKIKAYDWQQAILVNIDAG